MPNGARLRLSGVPTQFRPCVADVKHERDRKKKEVAEKWAQLVAERAVKKRAQEELVDIEREEARLRDRRQIIQKKFHIRSTK
jgi:hypothetical protein